MDIREAIRRDSIMSATKPRILDTIIQTLNSEGDIKPHMMNMVEKYSIYKYIIDMFDVLLYISNHRKDQLSSYIIENAIETIDGYINNNEGNRSNSGSYDSEYSDTTYYSKDNDDESENDSEISKDIEKKKDENFVSQPLEKDQSSFMDTAMKEKTIEKSFSKRNERSAMNDTTKRDLEASGIGEDTVEGNPLFTDQKKKQIVDQLFFDNAHILDNSILNRKKKRLVMKDLYMMDNPSRKSLILLIKKYTITECEGSKEVGENKKLKRKIRNKMLKHKHSSHLSKTHDQIYDNHIDAYGDSNVYEPVDNSKFKTRKRKNRNLSRSNAGEEITPNEKTNQKVIDQGEVINQKDKFALKKENTNAALTKKINLEENQASNEGKGFLALNDVGTKNFKHYYISNNTSEKDLSSTLLNIQSKDTVCLNIFEGKYAVVTTRSKGYIYNLHNNPALYSAILDAVIRNGKIAKVTFEENNPEGNLINIFGEMFTDGARVGVSVLVYRFFGKKVREEVDYDVENIEDRSNLIINYVGVFTIWDHVAKFVRGYEEEKKEHMRTEGKSLYVDWCCRQAAGVLDKIMREYVVLDQYTSYDEMVQYTRETKVLITNDKYILTNEEYVNKIGYQDDDSLFARLNEATTSAL